MSEALQKTIEDIGKAFEEFKTANDAEIKKHDAVTEAKIERLSAALDKLTEQRAALEKRADSLETKLNRQGAGGGSGARSTEDEVKSFNAMLKVRGQREAIDAEGLDSYRSAFNGFMRRGEASAEFRTMSVGVDPDGGYLVTPDVSGQIVTRIFETSNMRQLASVTTIGTDRLEGMIDTDEAAFGGWVSEMSARPNTGTPQTGRWEIPVHEMYANPMATQTLLDDANVNVESWLAAKVADKMSRTENAAFMTGTGQGQPKGIFSYATAATNDASRAWGTFEHIATGVNGDFSSSNPADIFFDLIALFKNGYLANASFLTRREVVAKVRKFKENTTNAYMWQPGLQAGQPDRLLGYPLVLTQDVPALANGSLSLAFGDFRRAYQIVDRAGFRTVRDALTNKPMVQFYTTRRVGGGALQFECVKFVKFGS